ncbi:hypothetical protein ZIOFF_000554 [Zingiber officinale]|uniref:Uncharacterized protein n=1 Tax=Zingiber officinale TaxID=94328 RepID=A0A8J5M7K5_ZINOF|nr:hypothetical protein ZIOFF_000554 [Zingiber officinale]
MSNHVLTRNTVAYKEAVKATEQIESPAIGFARPSDFQGPTSGNSAIIKQNNTQLQLLVQITEILKGIQADLKIIAEQTKKGVQTTSIPDDLVDKLKNLSLGPVDKLKEPRGKLRVFKNPYKILKEEQEKLKQ